MKKVHTIIEKQLSIDYCCTLPEVEDDRNHFTVRQLLEGRRRFGNDDNCPLKIAVVNGKLLFSGRSDIIDACRQRYADSGGEWFFEAQRLAELERVLNVFGCKLGQAHPFFAAYEESTPPPHDFSAVWYERDEIESFRGDDRFGEAFAFDPNAPDEIGVAAVRDGMLLGMAGASRDCDTMWQIGINVMPCALGTGVGRTLVVLLKNEVLRRGRIPFYGTAMSHIASQRVALGAGFLPEWAELVCLPL